MTTLGWPLPRRRQWLEDVRQQPTARKEQLRFQGALQLFDVYRMPIEAPKYRLRNGRTIGAQQDYLARHPQVRSDLFTLDAESGEAQAAQNEILLSMAGSGQTNLLRYFQDHEQEQPLVLDSNGFVVNGNRRLAAMRALYDKDPVSYARFSHVDAAVLPPADEKDIYELEVGLQIAPDIKMEYAWTDRALMLRNGRDLYGYSEPELARIYDLDVKDIRELLRTLDEGDAYLQQIGRPGQYKLIEDDEFAFQQMLKNRHAIPREADRLLFEQLSYAAIENPPPGGGRLYKVIREIRDYLPVILEEMSEALPQNGDAGTDGTGLEDILFPSEDGDANEKERLLESIRISESKELVSRVIGDVIQDQREQKRVVGSSVASLNHLKRANGSIRSAINSLTPASDLQAIRTQAAEIGQGLDQLREAIGDAVTD